jgi:peptidase S46-like protein
MAIDANRSRRPGCASRIAKNASSLSVAAAICQAPIDVRITNIRRISLNRTRLSAVVLAVLLVVLTLAPASADEGMWTLDAFPGDQVEKAYGFAPDQAWLDHVRLSSVRLARGCSASFVSPLGLVQTNHHCARGCIAQLSTRTEDLVEAGFYAKTAQDERKCPDVEVNQLTAISDVTARVNAAMAGRDGEALIDAKRAIEATIARECSGGDTNIRCDIVELYHGGIYNLYRYRRYQDVRLVFAPEAAIAFFGGDPDNFEFPRYDLDVTYLRVYADDRPLDTSANFLRYATRDVRPGDLTFTSGHPGRTHRLDTVAQLAFERDVTLPRSIFYNSELRGMLVQFSMSGAEQARIAKGMLFGVENSLKAPRRGRAAGARRHVSPITGTERSLRSRSGRSWSRGVNGGRKRARPGDREIGEAERHRSQRQHDDDESQTHCSHSCRARLSVPETTDLGKSLPTATARSPGGLVGKACSMTRQGEAAGCHRFFRRGTYGFHCKGVTASGVPLPELIQPAEVSLNGL